MGMATFKVGDRVRSVDGFVVSVEADVLVLIRLNSGTMRWMTVAELELVEPAAPDPRDAEIERLRSRVAELESRQADEDRAYYRQLVMAALSDLAREVCYDEDISIGHVCRVAADAFAEVKRREGGAA